MWTHGLTVREGLKRLWHVSSYPGWIACLYMALLFEHTTVPPADHQQLQHLQDAPQQSHLL